MTSVSHPTEETFWSIILLVCHESTVLFFRKLVDATVLFFGEVEMPRPLPRGHPPSWSSPESSSPLLVHFRPRSDSVYRHEVKFLRSDHSEQKLKPETTFL